MGVARSSLVSFVDFLDQSCGWLFDSNGNSEQEHKSLKLHIPLIINLIYLCL